MIGVKRAEPLKQFAESIGASYDTCFRAAHDGRLKVIYFGKRILVPAAEIERVMQEGLTRSSAKPGRPGAGRTRSAAVAPVPR